MAKRMTSTDKYKKPFFRGLKGAYKLFWDYLYHDCNHAGIWIVDFIIAQIYIGNDMPINKVDAIDYFNKDKIRIMEINNGKEWFIIPFIKYQYGELQENNRVHNSVIKILKERKLFKTLTRPLQGDKDKDKDKDKSKDMYPDFDTLLKYFTGRAEKEYTNINIEAVKTEAKLYFSVREETEWIKANGKKVKNWKNDCGQWILNKRSKLIDYKVKPNEKLILN
jgi:hypothetical protein